MKSSFIRFLFAGLLLPALFTGCSEKKTAEWHLAGSPLYTKWAYEIEPDRVWQEYPRPQLKREEWLNLNGLWDFEIVKKDSLLRSYDESILVPYPVESALSGIGKRTDGKHTLWYRREFGMPSGWSGRKIILHFEAADWETNVRVNGKQVGMHRGGYDPFSFDVTDFVRTGKKNTVEVSVWDPTDEGYQPRGKQVSDPRGIWYTPSSGIWQTVWMEPVAESYIEDMILTPDVDREIIIIEPKVRNPVPGLSLEISIYREDSLLSTTRAAVGSKVEIPIPDPQLWSPDHPFLYDLTVRLLADNIESDEVSSYFGMRKVSIMKDDRGFNRIALNNSILFQNGPLDQGFWPDGLYTPPSDEAMRSDLDKTKALGFNMLRKHVKIENRRFYHWCDRMGILVWQDMPNAAGFIGPGDEDLLLSDEHRSQFEYELKQMITTLYNSPAVIMWVPFNEGWGQYDTRRIVELVKSMDSTRLVDNASGWTDRGAGDVMDIHHYPDPRCPAPEDHRASVLGEFGGLGLYVEGHTWQQENWGYEKMQEVEDLIIKYEDFYREIRRLNNENGLAACIYTQTTDVETETNGLMTYDRDQVKMGIENIRKAHRGIIPPRMRTPLRTFIDSIRIELLPADDSASVQYCIYNPSGEDQWRDYKGPFHIHAPVTLKTRSYWPDGEQSRVDEMQFARTKPYPSLFLEVKPGLKVSYYEGNWEKLPDFEQLTPVKSGITGKPGLDFSEKSELFGLAFDGYLQVPETDVYLFSLSADDGVRMYLDGETCIDYDGIHGPGFRRATLALEKGLHPFRLVYFQRYGGLGLNLYWESQNIDYVEIKPENWKH